MAAIRVTLLQSWAAPRVELGHWRQGVLRTVGRPPETFPPVSTFAAINELSDGGPALIAAAARLHHEIGHIFGVPELPQLTLDGELAWPFWNRDRRPHVKLWAQANGVPILGEN